VQLLRAEIMRPRLLEYVSGMLLGAVLPFAFAYFAHARRWMLAVTAALLQLAFFPMLLNKMVLFALAWGAFLLVLLPICGRKSPRRWRWRFPWSSA